MKPYRHLLDFLLPAAVALALAGLGWVFRLYPSLHTTLIVVSVSCLAGAVCLFFQNRPRRFALGVGVLILAGMWFQTTGNQVMLRERDFFGVLTVTQDENHNFHVLKNGTTTTGLREQTRPGAANRCHTFTGSAL